MSSFFSSSKLQWTDPAECCQGSSIPCGGWACGDKKAGKVLKHRKLKTCLPIKIDFTYLGFAILSLVPHLPYNPSPRHIKSKLMCRHVNSYFLTRTNSYQFFPMNWNSPVIDFVPLFCWIPVNVTLYDLSSHFIEPATIHGVTRVMKQSFILFSDNSLYLGSHCGGICFTKSILKDQKWFILI